MPNNGFEPVSLTIGTGSTISCTGFSCKTISYFYCPEIEKVIFHDPATIVFWKDGTKTVVKVKPGEKFDQWTGLAMAHMKKLYGVFFHKVFKGHCKEELDET